jgi:hypothetical protein
LPSFQKGLAQFFPSLYVPADAPVVNSDGTITTTSSYNPNNGIAFNGVTPGVPPNFGNAHVHFFNPTVGIAYDVFGDGKTSLRGGYGVVHRNYFTVSCQYSCSNNYPVTIPINLITPPFPNPIGAQVAPATVPSLQSDAQNLSETQVRSYSVSLQHEFPGGWVVSLAGAGTTAVRPSFEGDINQPLPEGGYDFNPIINTGKVSEYAYGEPYPGYGQLLTYYNQGSLSWDALEFSARHPVGHNLFASVAYTWQKSLSVERNGNTDEGTPQNIYNLRADRGPSTSVPPQILAISAVWSPQWFTHGGGLRQWFLGNWQYSDVTTIQSGFPMDPGLSIATPGLATRPDAVPGQSVRGPKTKAEWFNTNAFAAPAAGHFGNASTGTILGPGVVDFDMALYKNFKVWESAKFQFRSEFFNVFNHTNFSGVSTGFGSGNFGQVTSALDPRIIELSLRFEF